MALLAEIKFILLVTRIVSITEDAGSGAFGSSK
jgi:hypothetical protein